MQTLTAAARASALCLWIAGRARSGRRSLLSTVSSSLLKMISPGDVSGLVTFTGDTVSSLMNTSCSSLRETIAVSGRLLKELRGAEAMDELEAVAADVSSLTLALEGVALEMLDGGETAPAGPKGDGEEEEEEEEAGAAVTSRRVRAVRVGFLEKALAPTTSGC